MLLRILMSSIDYAQKSAPVANGLVVNCLTKIYELIKTESTDDKLKKTPSKSPSQSTVMMRHTSSSRNNKGKKENYSTYSQSN